MEVEDDGRVGDPSDAGALHRWLALRRAAMALNSSAIPKEVSSLILQRFERLERLERFAIGSNVGWSDGEVHPINYPVR